MNELKICDISAGYGRRCVLSGVTLTVKSGEITVLLGENGCGKTTLFRAIQGGIPLRHGEIYVNDVPLSPLNPRKRARYVTMMPQENPPISGLTGRDLAETAFYPAHGTFGSPTESELERLLSTAEKFGAEHLLSRDLSEMSAGERQMMGLLRASVQDTPVLLLDEPSSALDFNKTAEMFAMLRDIASGGRIVLLILHDPTLALRHAATLARMAGKTIEEVFYNNAKNPREAEKFLQKLYPGIHVNPAPLFCYV